MQDKRIIRKKNAKIYPIYKMFAWDLLFFYSIQFLFYTITKGITPSEILILNGIYLIFSILMQIPAVIITDFIGKRNSIIIGNIFLVLHILVLICLPGIISIILANLLFALGINMKTIAETNLLYDSVSTRGGEGLFSKIDAQGGCFYYLLDGIASLVSGYLFVINNYIPVFICLIFLLISTILAFKFQDVYKIEKKNKKNEKNIINKYKNDLKTSFKFMFNSKRMKALILFQIVFYSLLNIFDTYNNELLITIGIPPEQFSMIFAILTFISGISLFLKRNIEKKFKNRTLTFLGLGYVLTCIFIGTLIYFNISIIPFILVMYAIQKISKSIWYILEPKYLNNFTKENERTKITFSYNFIGGIVTSIFSVIGGLLLNIYNIQNAFLIISLFFVVCMIITLDYMKSRIGLTPEEYKKEDINLNIN